MRVEARESSSPHVDDCFERYLYRVYPPDIGAKMALLGWRALRFNLSSISFATIRVPSSAHTTLTSSARGITEASLRFSEVRWPPCN